MTLAQLNALEETRFVALLGAVFEQSPWVAQRAWKRKPFASVDGLFQALADEVRRAGVMAEMRRRLGNQADAERANALEQLGHIARGRLDRVISGS